MMRRSEPRKKHRDELGQGRPEFLTINPMNQTVPMNQIALERLERIRGVPRCGARNRAGQPCQCPVMRGRGRCRLHGGRSPGAPKGDQNGNFRDGYWTGEAVRERRWAREMVERYTKNTDV